MNTNENQGADQVSKNPRAVQGQWEVVKTEKSRHIMCGLKRLFSCGVNVYEQRELEELADAHNASLKDDSWLIEERNALRDALQDARSTLMNLGIDNKTPAGLQLRKAAGRITALFNRLDSPSPVPLASEVVEEEKE